LASLYRYSIRHPKLVLAIAATITLAIAPGVLRLEIRTDGHALVPSRAPEIIRDQAIREAFSLEDPVVVLIRSDDQRGVFNVHTLELVKSLTERFQQIEGVRTWNVFSLATERGDRVKPGTLTFRRFLEPLPRTRLELERLRDDLRAIELYTGTLVSRDETATAILVGAPDGMDRTQLYRTIHRIIDEQGDLPEKTDVIGAPVAEALLGTHILEDLGVPSAVLGQATWRQDGWAGWTVPRTLYELRLLVARHVGLVPIALLVMAAVFFIGFRSLPAVAPPLMEVGACLISVFGLMGFLGVPVYLTIAVLPVILTAIGVADEIHIFARYQELLRARPDDGHVDVLTDTMDEMWVPVVKTSLTTAVAFLSFALSPIDPVRAFGAFTAVGIVFCMFWSLTVIPAMLVLLGPRHLRGASGDAGECGMVHACVAMRGTPLFARLGMIAIRLRFGIVLAVLAVVVAAPNGLRRIAVQDSWIDGFAPESEFYRATSFFNDQFLGTHMLLVCVDTGPSEPLRGELGVGHVDHAELRLPANLVVDAQELIGQRIYLRRQDVPEGGLDPRKYGRATGVWASRIEEAVRDRKRIVVHTSRKHGSPKLVLRLRSGERALFEIKPERLKRPEIVRHIAKLEEFLETHRDKAVGGVIGTASYLSTTEFMARGRREGTRHVPDRYDRIEWIWGQYGRVRGEERLRQVVSPDYNRAITSVFLKNANFVDTARLMESIRDYEREHLAPHGLSVEFAGDVAVSQTLISAIVATQVRSLIGSLVGIFVVTALLGRSVGWGLLCVLPCALAVLMNFAVMGWLGMPLGVATSMFAGMTLGIGVDFAIHLLERYRLARSRGLDLQAAVVDAVSATGPAIFIDATAVALGFGVMMLSQVPANARLGALVVLSIVNCLAVTLLLLPALLRIRPPRIVERATTEGSSA
jgi:hypothetical protein